MAKKVYIQPGMKILIIIIALVGVYFGVQALKKNGGLSKVTNAVAPASGGSSSGQVAIKVPKVQGVKPLVVVVNTWVGYASIVYYNGGLDATTTSRFYTEQGIPEKLGEMGRRTSSQIPLMYSQQRLGVLCLSLLRSLGNATGPVAVTKLSYVPVSTPYRT
jgi:hypothetical protein